MKTQAAKRDNPRTRLYTGQSVPVSEAARLTGFSVRTVKRMCAAGQLGSFRTPGGHVRVRREDLERFLRQASPAPILTSSALQTRRERIEELALEAQERRAMREIRKLDQEDAETERQRVAAAQAEQSKRKRVAEDARLQATRDAAERREREREREEVEERREWTDGWMAWGLSTVPKDAPREIELDVAQAVEETLARLAPEQVQSVVQRLVLAAIDKGLAPWHRRKEIEKAIQLARKELPFRVQRYFEPSEWELKAMERAREAIRSLPSDSTFEQLCQVAIRAGRQIAAECEAEEARTRTQAQAERERQQRESDRRFLISIGVEHATSYLQKLHSDGEIWGEDFERKSELEHMVRETLEARLTGAEGFEAAQRIAREVIQDELK
jgi:excisionase family DNA binding protein